MSIALVIPTADFSANAMEQIVVSEPIPCTGITLDRSTGEITAIGDSLTLIATPVPSDTTDKITWSSVDETVVIVNNGVVTTVGVGTATITATCGNVSAQCVITSRAFMNDATLLNNAFLSGNGVVSGGNGLPTIANNTIRGGMLSSSGTLRYYTVYGGVEYYPYTMPKNTKRIKVTRATPNILRLEQIFLFNANTSASSNPDVCQLINKEALTSNVEAEFIYTIPTYDGYGDIDAVTLGLKTTDEATGWQESLFNGITVEFLPAE